MSIVVFGSINMDVIARTSRFPQPGETVTGDTVTTVPGGKGANQAVACARLGVSTRLVGRIGNDTFGSDLRASLHRYGVDDQYVEEHTGASGIAVITVNNAGENTILVIPGANGHVGTHDLARLDEALVGARVLLLQLEVPIEIVALAARRARQLGVTVILDPAPVQPLPNTLLTDVAIITPNEHEAAELVGYKLQTTHDIRRAAHDLRAAGASEVVIKLGARGAYWTDGVTELFQAAYLVKAVDTVAAGDAFNGGLAVAVSEDQPRHAALQWAAATSAIAVTRYGAQTAMPARAEVEGLMRSLV